MKITFSINLYDKDGDIFEEGILLHLEDSNTILKIKDISELSDMIDNLNVIKKEISETT